QRMRGVMSDRAGPEFRADSPSVRAQKSRWSQTSAVANMSSQARESKDFSLRLVQGVQSPCSSQWKGCVFLPFACLYPLNLSRVRRAAAIASASVLGHAVPIVLKRG